MQSKAILPGVTAYDSGEEVTELGNVGCPRRWSADGTWKAVLEELQIEADAGDPDAALARQVARQEWAVNIDSTSCRAHQHAAGAPRKPPADHP
ncbi:hypothetical protein ACF1HJ_43830 [Streptomyces sp. NPDC013978]|uniref:hypothetical protein n=1 Tax=Streptomyces sp. NPDC013978 TaxID=3364869 RepID=UPI0036FE1029